MYLMRAGEDPFAVVPVFTSLRHLTNVDLGIEVCGKRLAVVTCIAVDYIQVMDLTEVMFGSMGSKDAGDARIKPAP